MPRRQAAREITQLFLLGNRFVSIMNEDEMWQAVVSNDASFDGRFFYAVASTGIYCRPSCKSKVPRRENVRFF